MLEAEIINLCIRNDRKGQEALYYKYAKKMKGICLRYASNTNEAEDIFHDAFIKVFSSIKNFKMQGSFEGWIRRIVINTAIDYYKKNLNLSNNVSIDDVGESELIDLSFDEQLHTEDLLKVLEKLPTGYKMIFNFYAIEGYSHKEIAELLSISEGTSKSQLSKARKYIQNILNDYKSIEA